MAQDFPVLEMPPIQEPAAPASDSPALPGDNCSMVTAVTLPLRPCCSVNALNSGELSVLSTKPRYLGRGSERRFANMILPMRFASLFSIVDLVDVQDCAFSRKGHNILRYTSRDFSQDYQKPGRKAPGFIRGEDVKYGLSPEPAGIIRQPTSARQVGGHIK